MSSAIQPEHRPSDALTARPAAADWPAGFLGHDSAIVWLTGLSGAGKTTLALALESGLRRERVLSAVLDGDTIRTGLSRDLGFSTQDRQENIRRTAEAAILLARSGVVAIVALISPFEVERKAAAERARAQGLRFAEIYINAPLAVCEQRDPKALYRRARAGEIRNLTGIDSPYEAPRTPDLELRTDRDTVPESTLKLVQFTLALVRSDRPASGSLRTDT